MKFPVKVRKSSIETHSLLKEANGDEFHYRLIFVKDWGWPMSWVTFNTTIMMEENIEKIVYLLGKWRRVILQLLKPYEISKNLFSRFSGLFGIFIKATTWCILCYWLSKHFWPSMWSLHWNIHPIYPNLLSFSFCLSLKVKSVLNRMRFCTSMIQNIFPVDFRFKFQKIWRILPN